MEQQWEQGLERKPGHLQHLRPPHRECTAVLKELPGVPPTGCSQLTQGTLCRVGSSAKMSSSSRQELGWAWLGQWWRRKGPQHKRALVLLTGEKPLLHTQGVGVVASLL